MALLVLNCPHCGTQKVQFMSRGEAVVAPGNSWVLLQCNNCKNSILTRIGYNLNIATPHSVATVLKDKYTIIDTHPSPRTGEAPSGTPENISKYYKQGVMSLEFGNYDASGVMFRKTIDIATKGKNVDSLTLVKRIDELAKRHEITEDMKEWAHEIRIGGNDAAHEDKDFTKEECEELLAFTELFLMYSFTLPEMMKRRKAARSS